MDNIIIIGAGGFGREVYCWAKDTFSNQEFQIKGFLSNNPRDLDNFDMDVPILEDATTYKIEEKDRFIFAIGDIDAKKRIVTNMKNQGAKFITLIHPTAVVAKSAHIGEGVIICPFALVSSHVELQDFVTINFYSSCGHDAKVGKYCILSPYATLNGFTILEDEVFLGTHATVTARKKVGYRSKVSANSVAMYDVPPHTLVYGVPGKNQTIFKEP